MLRTSGSRKKMPNRMQQGATKAQNAPVCLSDDFFFSIAIPPIISVFPAVVLYHHKFTAGGPHFCGLSIAFSAPQALLLFCLFWCCSIAFFALSTVKRQEEGKKCSGLPKYDNNILCINAKMGFWKNLVFPPPGFWPCSAKNSGLPGSFQFCRTALPPWGNIVKQVSYPRWKELFSVVP